MADHNDRPAGLFGGRLSVPAIIAAVLVGLGVAYLTAILVPGANPWIYAMGGFGGVIAAGLTLLKQGDGTSGSSRGD